MATRFVTPAALLDKLGKIVPGGQLFFYEPGQTVIFKDTFKGPNSITANANPVILDDAGVQPDIFGTGAYTVVFKTVVLTNLQLWEFEVTFVGDADLVVVYDDWDTLADYSKGDRVTGNDGAAYRSLTNSNIGNDPISSPAFWSRLADTTLYNSNETYDINDSAIGSNGRVYTSSVNGNLNNDPVTDMTSVWFTFSGAHVKAQATQTLSTGIATAVVFDGADIYDTNGFHNPASNNTRITTQANGRVVLKTGISFELGAALGSRQIEILRNGSASDSVVSMAVDVSVSSTGRTDLNITSPVILVTSGDYFEVSATQTSGGDLDLNPGFVSTWFAIEVVD